MAPVPFSLQWNLGQNVHKKISNINYEFYEPLPVWVWVWVLMLLVVYQGVSAGGRIVIKKIRSINYEFYEPFESVLQLYQQFLKQQCGQRFNAESWVQRGWYTPPPV